MRVIRKQRYNITDRFEHTLEGFICDAIFQRYIHCISLPFASALIVLRSSSREVFAELVKAACHDTIGGVERLFDAVTMVAVNVDIQYARKGAQEFQNAKDDVVDITKTGCFALLGVMKSTSPIDSDIGCAGVDALCGGL
jgi:hypothetical protein